MAFLRTEEDVVRVLGFCDGKGRSRPFGGGSSGAAAWNRIRMASSGSVTIDLAHSIALEVDPLRAPRYPARCSPSLEEQPRPSGFTLRHFPQSFDAVARRMDRAGG